MVAHVVNCARCQERVARQKAEIELWREALAEAPIDREGRPPERDAGEKPSPVGPPPIDPARLPLINDYIDNYQIVDVRTPGGRDIRSGGEAVLYKVYDRNSQKNLALKYFLRKLPDGTTAAEWINHEARVRAKLPENPGLVRVLHCGEHDRHPYLVTDYIDGPDLEGYRRNHHPSPIRSAKLVAKAARALGLAHKAGVVHRDIKPSNILVDQSNGVRVIDFGMALLRDVWSEPPAEDGSIRGTPAYMSPEQVSGPVEKIQAPADLFALGGVLYFLLMGRPPFEGPPRVAVARILDYREEELQAKLREARVHPRLRKILMRTMAKDPAKRHRSAEQLASQLEQFHQRPRKLALMSFALVLLTLLTAFRPADPNPGPPIGVKTFEVELHGHDSNRKLGLVGSTAFEGKFQDNDVRITATLDRRGYAYVLGLNPDGKVQSCYPEDPQIPPPFSAQIDTPSNPKEGFGLTDGVGLQSYVLIVSSKPLPGFNDWRRKVGNLPWKAIQAEGVWWFDGRKWIAEKSRGGSRPLGDLDLPPKPLEDTRELLQSRPEAETIRVRAFPIKDRSRPGNAATPEGNLPAPPTGEGGPEI